MATIEQLSSALQKADAAGNKEDAKVLADAIRQMQSATVPPQGQVDTSIGGALGNSIDTAQSTFGSGLQSIGELSGSQSLQDYGQEMAASNDAQVQQNNYQRPAEYDGIWKNLKQGEFAKAGGSLMYGAAESAPSVGIGAATSLAAAGAVATAPAWGTAALLGGAAVGTAYGTVNALGENRNEKTDKGLDPTATATDLGSAVTSGLIELIPSKGGFIIKMLKEGLQEAGQEGLIVGGTAIQGGEYVPSEVIPRLIDAGIVGAAISGTVDVASKGLSKAANGMTTAPAPDTQESRAKASLAKRIQTIAAAGDENGKAFDLKDINKTSQSGARAVIDAVHTDLVGQIASEAKVLKAILDPTELDTYETALQKVMAQVGQKMARNKTKSVVTKANFDALETLVGQHEEGQRLMNLIRESQALTGVHNDGYQGGLTQYTDQFKIFGSGIGYDKGAIAAERMLRPLMSVGAGLSTGGTSLAVQQGIATTGSLIDKATGKRSKVANFIKANSGRNGLDAPNMPSVRDARIAAAQQATDAENTKVAQGVTRAEQLRQTNLGLVQQNAPPAGSPGNVDSQSPQYIVEEALQLDRNGVAQIMRVLDRTNSDPIVSEAIAQYRKSVAEGGRIQDLTPLLRILKSAVNTSPALRHLKAGSQQQQQQQAPQQQQQQAVAPKAAPVETEGYRRGIQANLKFVSDMITQVGEDPMLSAVHKAKIQSALDKAGMNLGEDPVGAMQNIITGLIESGVPKDAVERHVVPYADRVKAQQKAAPFIPPQEAPKLSMAGPDAPAPRRPQITSGAVTGVPMATNLSQANDMAGKKVYTKGRQLKVDLQAAALASQQESGINLTTLDDANIERLADFAIEDALEALQDNQNAIGWYDRTVTKALEIVGELHPEVITDPVAKLQFVWAVAVTSNGLKVDKNFELALDVYEALKADSKFPAKAGIGTAAKAINGGLAQYHSMLAKFDGDHSALVDFMNSKVLVRDLEKEYGVDISGEGKGTLVRGAAILGPKIGNGFFSNLYGNFDELTMDRWLMRTVGRWRGTLIDTNPSMQIKKRKEMGALLKDLGAKKRNVLKKLYAGSDVVLTSNMTRLQLEDLADETAKRSMEPDWRTAINGIEGGEDLRKIGNGLSKYLDGQVEAPAGARERTFIRAVFNKALEKLQNDPSVRALSNQALTMSDLQALLWYPEKLLYDKAKQTDGDTRGYTDEEAPDYANAARKAVGDRLGSPRATGPGGRGPDSSNAGQPTPNLSRSGVLERNETGPRDSGRSTTTPSLVQVKAQLPLANAPFEIGKKGGPFSNGIKTLVDAQRLATALGITLKRLSTAGAMFRLTRKRGATGAYWRGDRKIATLASGAMTSEGMILSSEEATVLLHEIGHDMAAQPSTSGVREKTPVTNPLVLGGVEDDMFKNSFNSIIEPLLSERGSDFKSANEVIKEIMDLQKNGFVTISNRHQTKVRAGYTGSGTEKSNNYERTYLHSLDELTTDPIWVYLADPDYAKKVMPKTTKIIRDYFNKLGGPVTFFSHPFATILAMVLASIAMDDDEEEKKLQTQVGDGALSQSAGPLTSA